ncbi:TPA: hypothetical protein DDW69_01085 [candidate division CPR2 bacterium]|uniref:Uncharacterized protein n=1 Tax=candidate division CPR2 bacterium GW2011_GWC1_41_48 TaxID=1618344 RepID=A0A0G0Z9C6_UNCC2|nr:MAG: hypothetical protein UT47_C0001G0023 [candidate division CPR2 bacterium GW2011_GWC2_39_35]KKR28213.1 MAG: hypothetical protein UT60_C0025G0011 [candidate division CPR2 bacterium GW2011_GWD2_39_7]KKR28644.1 MAG: hypothetical protein UT59_C0022G0012 [candidate division CPR2 bacterium GW2011_GWD1_39_7]KKS09618.1 MAG: hypothetical protein UU65_C0001G0023 [candidate division CPR2 bacterium GW2011_GWC1_41_48]OGB61327.1 MAG: hypothetical protein A2Y27_02715 [candidate division CPR2 bacterium G
MKELIDGRYIRTHLKGTCICPKCKGYHDVECDHCNDVKRIQGTILICVLCGNSVVNGSFEKTVHDERHNILGNGGYARKCHKGRKTRKKCYEQFGVNGCTCIEGACAMDLPINSKR